MQALAREKRRKAPGFKHRGTTLLELPVRAVASDSCCISLDLSRKVAPRRCFTRASSCQDESVDKYSANMATIFERHLGSYAQLC